MSSPTIQVRGLRHRFGGTVLAIDGIDLEIEAGELVGLVGPNGAGKSTLLRVLAGRLRPGEGRARVLGTPPHRAEAQLRRRLRWIEQDASLDPEMTGRETARLFAHLYGAGGGRRAAQMADPVLERYGLGEHADRRVSTYSGGLRRRLHVAVGVLGRPEVLLLDEPTAGLDARGRRRVWTQMRHEADRGASVVISSHDLDEVARHCTRVVVIDRGRVCADESPQVLARDHAAPTVAVQVDELAPTRSVLEQLDEAPTVTARGSWVVASGPGLSLSTVVTALSAAGIEPEAIEHRAPSLAAAYLALTGDLRGARAADAQEASAAGGGRGRGPGRRGAGGGRGGGGGRRGG